MIRYIKGGVIAFHRRKSHRLLVELTFNFLRISLLDDNVLSCFTAEVNGGAVALKAISAALPQLRFCPTGGISEKNLAHYLVLDCVATVGGSWMLPNDAIVAKD